jgi:HEAT repeat protein
MNKANPKSQKCPRCGIFLNTKATTCPNCGYTSFQSCIGLVTAIFSFLLFGQVCFYLSLQSGDFGWIVFVISTLISILGGFVIYGILYTVLSLPSVQKMQKRKDITGLIKMLSHPESEIRRVAVLALGEIGDERAIEPLISALSKDLTSARAASESLIRIGTVSAEPLIAVINRACTLNVKRSYAFHFSGEEGAPVFALEILGKIGGVSAIRPIINLASTNINYSNRALESLEDILGRHIVDTSIEDLRILSNLQGIRGITGQQPLGTRDGSANDYELEEPTYGLLKSQMSQLRLTAMQELKRRNIETEAQPSQQEKRRQVEESLSQAQYEREQRISQLDKEISSLNQEVDKLNRQMPKLSNWSPIFSLLLIIGGLYGGLYTLTHGSSENIGLYFLIGGISVITGFGLMIKRNRFYKKNCKPVLDEIEKKKQHLLQLVRESQNLKNARY